MSIEEPSVVERLAEDWQRQTNLSLRRYLLPKDTEEVQKKFTKKKNNKVEKEVLIAIDDQAALVHKSSVQ